MSRRRITIQESGRQVVLRGWKVAELAREAGAKPIFVGSVSGWMIDAARLPDLLAVLERRGIAVATDEGVQTAYPPSRVTDCFPAMGSVLLGSQKKGVQDLHTPMDSKTGGPVFEATLWDPTDGGDAA